MGWKLEAVSIPASDVNCAKTFYAEKVGFNVDLDVNADGALQAPRQTKLLLVSATRLLRPSLRGFWDRKLAGGVDQGSRWRRT
jgi:hypothetical protein